MKYVVVLGDGMADYRMSQLGNRTPLQYARKPNIDFLAANGETGIVRTIPEGASPGSDTANLSVMGYDPMKYYTGRSPLEAVSMGVQLADTDLAFRCNLVTLDIDGDYESAVMIDYSSDEISTSESTELINEINKQLSTSDISFHAGISYRHCMVWHAGSGSRNLTPPHDILEKRITPYLPSGDNSDMFVRLQKKSNEILTNHPVNKSRISRGLRPANSIWLWGEGRKPGLPDFTAKYGLSGSVVSAVDLIKGIGICAGLDTVDVAGATGNINTNFRGKAEAALKELQNGKDFVYIHIEAPDECGHRFEIENKVRSIELIDELVVGVLLEGLAAYDDFSLMVLPDHPTPLSLRTHTSDPVPYVIYRKRSEKPSGVAGYDEFQAQETGVYVEEGHKLMERFLQL
ncbi:MAG: cofactor-independent phosphoglycerate mutase [Acetivibrionales bacterium]|jgi:2,3-bisphosphoglycerate-independent phosphoglycerate mutase|nr:cofactor-independent phosphoglycerate mutase [Bacillota bacterium]NLP07626.1 cofactor-independent phosphoglycerate mutase [Clostridiaceae bacterium]HOA54248.1 cofactor-independent phosphoglycerate mutase [Clostridiales bacterium]HQD30595.1 cofactor-independent phosphoglycerate mutase [Clostridiales bacterium]